MSAAKRGSNSNPLRITFAPGIRQSFDVESNEKLKTEMVEG